MKSGILLIVAVLISAIAGQNQGPDKDFIEILQDAFDNQLSGIQIQGEGVVTRILPDDLEGDKHQRFIIGNLSAFSNINKSA